MHGIKIYCRHLFERTYYKLAQTCATAVELLLELLKGGNKTVQGMIVKYGETNRDSKFLAHIKVLD